MTHQQNKHFNTYKEGLDLEFMREYCMEHGERRTFERGETQEEAGEPAQWVAYVERGCFKYMVHNDEDGRKQGHQLKEAGEKCFHEMGKSAQGGFHRQCPRIEGTTGIQRIRRCDCCLTPVSLSTG